jgi:hypothetical protein
MRAPTEKTPKIGSRRAVLSLSARNLQTTRPTPERIQARNQPRSCRQRELLLRRSPKIGHRHWTRILRGNRLKKDSKFGSQNGIRQKPTQTKPPAVRAQTKPSNTAQKLLNNPAQSLVKADELADPPIQIQIQTRRRHAF